MLSLHLPVIIVYSWNKHLLMHTDDMKEVSIHINTVDKVAISKNEIRVITSQRYDKVRKTEEGVCTEV